MRYFRASAVLLLVMSLLVAPTIAGAEPRAIDDPCPSGSVPGANFRDVPAGSVHAHAIDCAAWWQLAQGRTSTVYAPGEGVTRAQLASFIARLIRLTETPLPDGPDAFGDDDGNVHEHNINALANANIVQGRIVGVYGPHQVVPRDQMATFLVRAFEYIHEPLADGADAFGDDGASVHHANINKAAAQGIAGGVADETYAPNAPVQRDQMASFLMRTLDLIAERIPAAPVTPPRRGGDRPEPPEDDEDPPPDDDDDDPAPLVFAVTPDRGDSAGGLRVEIRGDNFDDDARVTFGGLRANNVDVDGEDLIRLTTPEADELWDEGIDLAEDICVDVVVRNRDGQSATRSDGYCFFYLQDHMPAFITDASPPSGTEGTVITVLADVEPGQGFDGSATVWFLFDEPVEADVEHVSRYEMKVTAPEAPEGTTVVEVFVDQNDFRGDTFEFTYLAEDG